MTAICSLLNILITPYNEFKRSGCDNRTLFGSFHCNLFSLNSFTMLQVTFDLLPDRYQIGKHFSLSSAYFI